MTLEELRTKDDEELMRLNMDGSITDNEYFLATEAYRDLYLDWLHGRQPTNETAKDFKPVCDVWIAEMPDHMIHLNGEISSSAQDKKNELHVPL